MPLLLYQFASHIQTVIQENKVISIVTINSKEYAISYIELSTVIQRVIVNLMKSIGDHAYVTFSYKLVSSINKLVHMI